MCCPVKEQRNRDGNLKTQFLIKSSYYIVPSPSTSLNNNYIYHEAAQIALVQPKIFFFQFVN